MMHQETRVRRRNERNRADADAKDWKNNAPADARVPRHMREQCRRCYLKGTSKN